LTVEPENQQKLIELLRGNTESVVTRLDGWISTALSPQRISATSHLLAVARLRIGGGDAANPIWLLTFEIAGSPR